MIIILFLILSTCFLAYSNGANDNFKGVATLFGSETTTYRIAIWWATITTFAGSVCSIFLAERLLKAFSGKGLVPDTVANSPEFLLAVSLGAGATVMLAALRGYPISTTHSLTGALVGAGLMSVGWNINLSVLGSVFFLPLLLSPLIAVLLGGGLYYVLHISRHCLGISKEHCLCIGEREEIIPIPQADSCFTVTSKRSFDFAMDKYDSCVERYKGVFLGINLQKALDYVHFISAGIVSFARGLNDTPKIVAILVAANALNLKAGLFLVGVAIAIGGLLNARRVAETMSNKITTINHGQGFSANIVTGFLVIFASRLGIPVSTTHVSVGAIFGIGTVSRKADAKVVSHILLSWLLTLPIAALISGMIKFILI